jgi:hypothetical protein
VPKIIQIRSLTGGHVEKGELAPSAVRAKEASERTYGSKERRFKQEIERVDLTQREMKNDPVSGSSNRGSTGSTPDLEVYLIYIYIYIYIYY